MLASMGRFLRLLLMLAIAVQGAAVPVQTLAMALSAPPAGDAAMPCHEQDAADRARTAEQGPGCPAGCCDEASCAPSCLFAGAMLLPPGAPAATALLAQRPLPILPQGHPEPARPPPQRPPIT